VLDRAPELIGVAKATAAIAGAVRPDGRTVATTGWDAGVTIFDAETRKVVAYNNDIPLYGVRFNPNGTQLAAAVNPSMPSGERRVDPLPLRMFDPQTAALAPTQLGGMPKGRVVHLSLAFSSNGRWLAAGFVHPTQLDEDTWIRVWDTRDLARPVAASTVPFLAKDHLAVSGDGKRVYLAGGDGSVLMIDAASGRVLRSAPDIEEIALSADGATLAAVRGRQIVLLDPERLTVKSVIEENEGIGGLMFSPRGEKLGYEVDNALVVRSLAEPEAGVRISGPEAGLSGIGFSPDGRTLYSRGGDRLLVWDLVGDRRFVRSVPVQPQPDSARIVDAKVSPDGRTVANLLIANVQESFAVQFLEITSGKRIPPSAFRKSNTYFIDMVWRPDGRMVASAHNDQWVDLWDGVTGKAVGQHRVPHRYGVVDSAAFSGDGSRLVVGTHLGWVYAVDASTLEVIGKPVQVKAGVPTYGLAVNGDGSRALVWIDRRLQLLDLSAGRVVDTTDPRFDVASWAWLPDGKAVVVVGSDPTQDGHGTVAFLDPQTLATRSRLSGPQVAGGWWIQFSSDGTRFTTSGSDRVGLWDARTRSYLGSVRAEGDSTAGFLQGASDVLIASRDGKVSVWDPRPEAAVRAACRIAGREMTDAEWRTYLPERDRQPVCGS
jgi:WD40 repeat protein